MPMACDIAERNQNAASVGQQFLRVPIGRRDHRLPQAEAVGQRAGCHLRLVQIRRDVDIAHRDEVEQRRLVDELIEEHDVIFDAERRARATRLSR